MLYTKKETQWLIKNYPILGTRKCANKLNKTYQQVRSKVEKLKLKIKNKGIIHKILKAAKKIQKYEYKIPHSGFINLENLEHCYILGLLWADGYVTETKSGSKRIALEVQKEDGDYFEKIFDKTGSWSKHYRKRHNRKRQTLLVTSNSKFYDFLHANNYTKKSTKYPLLWKKLNDRQKIEWLVGYLDGDGCIYYNFKNYCYQVAFSGNYKQNWSFLKEFCEEYKIKYGIQLVKNKLNNSKYSAFRITGKNNTNVFLSLIYKSKYSLPRKKKKFKEGWIK